MSDVVDHDDIPGGTRAFRLVRREDIKPAEGGGVRPSSAAFQNHPEDDAMSVYLECDIEAEGKSPSDLLKLEKWAGNYRLCSLTVDQLRNELDQVIVRDRQEDFPGHAQVRDADGRRKRGQSTRSKMAFKAVWYDPDE